MIDRYFFEGGEIFKNREINRLQFLLGDYPQPSLREILKKNGFRWSRNNRAWQRELTKNALKAARKVLDELYE